MVKDNKFIKRRVLIRPVHDFVTTGIGYLTIFQVTRGCTVQFVVVIDAENGRVIRDQFHGRTGSEGGRVGLAVWEMGVRGAGGVGRARS